MAKRRVLFLCKGNSCRSQMAEGFLRCFALDSFEVFSGGSEPTPVHPLAVQVMGEVGIDISGQKSKNVSVFQGHSFDFVITVCKEETCPVFIGDAAERLAWSFEDPAAASGTDEAVFGVFREVRDDIKERVRRFVEECEPR